jgi:hypothetical protein
MVIIPGSTINYQAMQEIIGKHLLAKEWIEYLGKLTVYDN